jgi:hypothetical protein
LWSELLHGGSLGEVFVLGHVNTIYPERQPVNTYSAEVGVLADEENQ